MKNVNHDTIISLRMSTDLLESLKVYAHDVEERTVSDVIRRLVTRAISDSETAKSV